ncbi:MAG TPA: ATP-binding cassette domain-containing protein [Acidimicrobiia bacterium]|nr:ATP-binding cassette domain-containing protein [Acidimicrobiia bacterium]
MALLEVEEVFVRFGGLHALNGVSITVEPGHVTGLIGPNGAGKTTLFNVVTGLQEPDDGRVTLDGKDITDVKPHRRARLGVGRTFQRLETFGMLTARDNVLVAAQARRGWGSGRFDIDEKVDEIVDLVGLRDVADVRVDRLPTGTARLIELARALAIDPRVLLVDEPSAGLNEQETLTLGELLLDLSRNGLGILLVEHDMSFVMGTCEQIHVLDFGQVIAVGTPTEIQEDPAVRAAYLGSGDEEVPAEEEPVTLTTVLEQQGIEHVPSELPDPAGTALALRSVTAGYGPINVLQGIDLTVMPGQVFALLGPNGAGKSTTLKVASGQIRPSEGDLWINGSRVAGESPDQLARSGVCLVPEGRGIFPNLTVTENLRIATYTGTSMSAIQERAYERFPILRDRRKQVAGTLSGGEQQMLSMARALATDPNVLLLDELSMGLAPLIVERLYEVVRGIAEEDVAILVVEQFAHEVLGIADVAGIIFHGRVEFTGSPEDVGNALQAAYLGGVIEG